MPLAELRVGPMRRVEDACVAPAPGLTILAGGNAQGKTTILEAAAYLATGRSFRTARDRECIPLGGAASHARASARWVRNGTEHEVRLAIGPEGKQLALDGKPVRSLSELVGRFPTVILVPEDLDLARGAPSARRRFADLLLAQMSPEAMAALMDHERALRGRNALLRRGTPSRDRQYDAFEDAMARCAARIHRARRALAAELEVHAAAPMASLSGATEALAIAHEPGTTLSDPEAAEEDLAEQFRARWAATRDADIDLCSTREGPLRDDLAITVAGLDARRFASQGQCRTAVLALRLAETHILRLHTGEAPTLLMDDVLGELDEHRAERFLRLVSGSGAQAIAAATDTRAVEAAGLSGSALLLRIREGRVAAA
jgi:DNA replication and repair protein RecF